MQISITDHGATAGHNNQQAIQAAIDAVADAGGGRVVVPAGTWPSTSVQLRSRVELHLCHGARILAIDDESAYESVPGTERPALLWAHEARDIALTGTGALDGNGDSKRWEPDIDPNEFRMSLIIFHACHDVRIHDVNLWWSRMWTVHLHQCEDVQVRGVDLRGRRDRINTDGIDPDDCRRVRISDCHIATGDDAIVIKSTSGKVCEDILVSGCVLESSCAAIKIGTESHGVIRNVVVTDCIVRDANVGMALYLKDGGTYESIRYSGCLIEACAEFPVLIDHTRVSMMNRPGGGVA